MEVTYFRPRRSGPEQEIEEAVARHLTYLFPSEDHLVWAAGSVPLGAGMPDLIVVTCKSEVKALACAGAITADILAYLRVVQGAKTATIAQRVAHAPRAITRSLDELVDANAVSESNGVFVLNSTWRNILADVATIEVKTSKWQKAVSQAARNHLFAHRSYIAIPSRVTSRIRGETIFRQLGIGLLSARENGEILVSRRPRRRLPRVWAYYYKLALILAASFGR